MGGRREGGRESRQRERAGALERRAGGREEGGKEGRREREGGRGGGGERSWIALGTTACF